MTVSSTQTSGWRRQLGLTPGNPFAPYLIGLLIVVGIGLIVTLIFTFIAQPASARFWWGVAFMFIGGLSPVFIALLIMIGRNYVRIQDMVNGNYWVHWQYPTNAEPPEVYIGADGIYYPNRPLQLSIFWSGLQSASVVEGNPSTLQLKYLYKRYYSTYMPPMSSTQAHVIPIPSGKEDEAQSLVERFKKLAGQPSDFINDQWRIGYIMGAVIIGFVILSALLLVPIQSQVDTEKYAKADATNTAIQATAVVQLHALLPPIRAVMDKQIEYLKTLPDGKMSAQDAGFDESSDVDTVYYGHCLPDKAFYIYVVMDKEMLGRNYLGGRGAFNYTTATDRRYADCGPDHLLATLPDKLQDGWYYSVMAFIQSTRTPRIIDTPTPIVSPSPSK